MKKVYLIASAFLLMLGVGIAQNNRTCAAMDVLQQQLSRDPTRAAALESIEKHTQTYIQNGAPKSTAAVRIPVVFHIVYNTTAQNISDARINAQLSVLNQDFRKLNPDASSIPSIFSSVAADASIEFCLATVSPTGSATNGIVRKSTTVTSFSTNDNVKRSANGGDDAWDASRYLNIWVCNLSGGVLGYAQFPGGAASTDGVVLLFSAVGGPSAPGTSTPYHLGRTATHEVGHWLNLRHIWGDATCGSDLVSDTPTHNAANYGCPTFPHYSTCTGAPTEMTMNYMDYSDDACMYMFSAGQSSRMNALFAAGGSRASLMSSNGCGGTAPSCGIAVGLNATSITATSATLSWTAVSGATSYNVRYKPTASSTWTTVSSTTTTRSVTGLTAATTYEFQVQTVCSATSASYSSSFNFSTTGSTGTSSTLTIGTGTATTSNAPYGTYYMDQRCQFIITASELSAAGYTSANNIIRSLAFFTGTASTQAMNAFTIRILHTSRAAFSNTSFLSTSGSTQVFSGTFTATSNGWNTHTFTTPFTYNGTSNLLIDICFNNSSFSSDTPVRFTSTSTNFRTLFRKSDSASGNICGTTTGTRSYDRPNMRLVFANTTARMMGPEQEESIATGVQLYPNPSNGLINLSYAVANENTPVSVEVYTTLGSRVYSMNKGISSSGNFIHTMDLSAEDYPAGIYLCVIRIGETTETVRFILNK